MTANETQPRIAPRNWLGRTLFPANLRKQTASMNLALRLPTPELESRFLWNAQAAGFSGLEGHRSVGGVRLSLYNGVTLAAVDCLADFLSDFEARWDTTP